MECMTVKEKNLLVEFRERIKGLTMPQDYWPDKNLIRWLRVLLLNALLARNYDLDDAEKMLRDNIKWRCEFNIDAVAEIDEHLPPEHSDLFKFDCYGFDDDGGLVHIIYGKTVNLEKAVRYRLLETLSAHALGNLEKGWKLNVKHSEGKDYIPKFVSIYDMEGLSFSQMGSPESINYSINIVRKMDTNYPECAKRIFVVNASWMFQMVWKVVKAILAERTTERFLILGSDKNQQRLEISKFLQPHQFPEKYGGDGPNECTMSLKELEEAYEKSQCSPRSNKYDFIIQQ